MPHRDQLPTNARPEPAAPPVKMSELLSTIRRFVRENYDVVTLATLVVRVSRDPGVPPLTIPVIMQNNGDC